MVIYILIRKIYFRWKAALESCANDDVNIDLVDDNLESIRLVNTSANEADIQRQVNQANDPTELSGDADKDNEYNIERENSGNVVIASVDNVEMISILVFQQWIEI